MRSFTAARQHIVVGIFAFILAAVPMSGTASDLETQPTLDRAQALWTRRTIDSRLSPPQRLPIQQRPTFNDGEQTVQRTAATHGVPRSVSVPEWGVELRDGIDVGRGQFSFAPAGPWSGVENIAAMRSTASPPMAVIAPHDAYSQRERGGSRKADRVVDMALTLRGTPYAWGGTNPSGFDCAGFVQYVFATVGISLPRSVERQYRYGAPIPNGSIRPGDVLFFDELRHNGIYIGDGRLVHAARLTRSVTVAPLDDQWFRSHWVGARRMSRAPAAPAKV